MKIKINILIFLFFVLISSTLINAQNVSNSVKAQALIQMQNGRYGEAIDLLNKYISAEPQKADGYNLRALCYEQRGQFEQSVYDLRAARKIEPNNGEINRNLDRVTKKWYAQLYDKIEGHKREIAIDPNVAVNYLEIGKCYKNLGQWLLAEQWYDEYLKREEASADEIIRYTEILARNNHIQKGEPILKRYTEKYPNDHRIWSRYGYFTLWLGKRQIAIEAFQNALALRPFFKEAMDGLDVAMGKDYTYTYFDTTYRYQPKKPKVQEYPIDKYYRIVKRNPSDDETRFLLVEELKKNNRIEEAYQQLLILQNKYIGTARFDSLWTEVSGLRDQNLQQRYDVYLEKFKSNPNDKEIALGLADIYSNLYNLDSAIIVLQTYLNNTLSKENLDVRYKLAQIAAWNKNWDIALEQLNYLLSKEPNNQDYRFLRAQVAVWTQQDFDLAKSYLEDYMNKYPDNIDAIITYSSLQLQLGEFDIAEEYANKVLAMDSSNALATQLISNIELAKLRAEQDRLFFVLQEARMKVYDGNCIDALPMYDEYLSKAEPNILIKKEYADVQSCAGNYDMAISIYNEILAENYDYDIAFQRAKTYFAMGDSINALIELQKLNQEQPENRDVQLLLSDAYMKNRKYGEAEKVLNQMMKTNTDSTERALITMRMNWLPVTGFGSFLSSFPNYVGIAPYSYYYNDNYDLEVHTFGGRTEFGITTFMTIGLTFFRTNLSSPTANTNLTTFKGNLFLRLSDLLSAGGGFGQFTIKGQFYRNVFDVFLKLAKTDNYSLLVSYERTDAAPILLSTFLINNRVDADVFRFAGEYKNKSGLKINLNYNYMSFSDDNEENDLTFRIGKLFYEQIYFGYEYFYQTFRFVPLYFGVSLYYAPQDFNSHSLWSEWTPIKNSKVQIDIGGKFGYIPNADAFIRDVYLNALYKPFWKLAIVGRIGSGSTFRYDSRYNSFYFSISAFLTL